MTATSNTVSSPHSINKGWLYALEMMISFGSTKEYCAVTGPLL